MAKQNYPFRATESKWQTHWSESEAFLADNTSKPNYYVLEMFPYPSGKIHMGHLRNYAIGDVLARFRRMQGFHVLHPMGFDSFGLPAENAAIERNLHPGKWTYDNIDHMQAQLKSIGLSYDWSRSFATCDADYYRHEQAMFLDFLEKGLAYQKEAWVNWDPVDHTVLANEQVVEGKGWRSGATVERKKLRQWFLRISDFAEPLLDGLDALPGWPDNVKHMQKRWIGKSQGLTIHFAIEGKEEILEVYTTRPDTIFGASFCAISVDHPLAERIAQENSKAKDFADACRRSGLSEEAIETMEKRGFDTGLRVVHPFETDKTLPVYIANFVLMEYGSGAIFGCPAHDQRDLDFALRYDLPVTVVISPKDELITIERHAYSGDGVLVNSSFLDGMDVASAKAEISKRIEEMQAGSITTQYRLRDWGVSRQRYWGCPIPIINCDSCGAVPVPAAELPVTLPEDVDFSKAGNPLERHPTWKHTTCPKCGKAALRETDTFDTFFESSWYFARFCAPKSHDALDKKACDHWLPVDYYIGGVEHAVLHLLYARFFTLALNHCGYLNQTTPFARLLTQGMVCHKTFQDSSGAWLSPDDVTTKNHNDYVTLKDGAPVTVGRSQKMSKSKKNTVDPQHIITSYGADTARLFMLSDSPPERDLEWSDAGIEGAWRYINRLWRSVFYASEAHRALSEAKRLYEHAIKAQIHKTIAHVTEDLDACHFNRAIARIRELTNGLMDLDLNDSNQALAYFDGMRVTAQLLAPFIPHLSAELWELLKQPKSLEETGWPKADTALFAEEEVTIAIQVNGKLKATITMPKDTAKETLEDAALTHPNIEKMRGDKPLRKVIVVPNRIVNIVLYTNPT